MNLRSSFIALVLIISSYGLSAQIGYDFGLRLGGTNYFGEIGGGSGEGRPFSVGF